MACRDSIHMVKEPEAVRETEQASPGQDVTMTAGATDALWRLGADGWEFPCVV
jgi:hypothetical protein